MSWHRDGLPVLLVALAASAYGESDPGDPLIPVDTLPTTLGRTSVLLTDSPFPFDAVQRVEVYIESIAASASADTAGDVTTGWVTVAEPAARFDLLQLQRGTTALLGEGDLPAGAYRAVRMVVNTDSSWLTYNDGTRADVQWQVAGSFQLNALVEAPIDVPDSGAQIVIDFDVGRSFVRLNDRGVGVVADTVSGAR